MRLALLTLLAVAAMSASVLFASHSQRSTADRHGLKSRLTDQALAGVFRAEGALSTFALTGDEEALGDFR
jgi:hypothetical protein